MTCSELASRAQLPRMLPVTQGLHTVHGTVLLWVERLVFPGHLPTLTWALDPAPGSGWELEPPRSGAAASVGARSAAGPLPSPVPLSHLFSWLTGCYSRLLPSPCRPPALTAVFHCRALHL